MKVSSHHKLHERAGLASNPCWLDSHAPSSLRQNKGGEATTPHWQPTESAGCTSTNVADRSGFVSSRLARSRGHGS